ncbi:22541_t:CDS:2, partial [Dentiscutata erythropus]
MFSETASEDNSFFESSNNTLVSTYTDNDKELVSINNTQFDENVLGSEFKNYTSSLSLITTSIKIEVGTQFISMPVAIHYIEQYAFQNHFSVYKHKCETFTNSICRKRVLNRYDTTMIKNLLQPKYLKHVFFTQNLGNAIQKIKREKEIKLSNTASLLTKLLELKFNDLA